MPWPWLYLVLTFIFAAITGFALFSKGVFFMSTTGQVIQGLFSIICMMFIVVAFWIYGWKIGLLELFIIFFGINVGLSMLKKIS